MTINLENKLIPEENKGKVLGLPWSSDLTWTTQIEEVIEKFGKKSRGVSQVMSYKQRKELAEGTLCYGIELTSSASEKDLKRFTSL